jgi:hypothetical protein
VAAAAVLVLAVAAGSASAARGDPQKELTPADQARARSMLLKRSDLGPGFKATRQSSVGGDLYCKALDESDLTVNGDAESPNFERGVVTASSAAQVYESLSDANTSWRRGTGAAGLRCARDVLRRGFAKAGIKLESYNPIPFPNVAQRTAAYRAVVSATSQGVKVRLVFDFVALMHSRAQAALFFTGLAPIPRAELLQLARLTSLRMEKAMRGA